MRRHLSSIQLCWIWPSIHTTISTFCRPIIRTAYSLRIDRCVSYISIISVSKNETDSFRCPIQSFAIEVLNWRVVFHGREKKTASILKVNETWQNLEINIMHAMIPLYTTVPCKKTTCSPSDRLECMTFFSLFELHASDRVLRETSLSSLMITIKIHEQMSIVCTFSWNFPKIF